MRIDDPEGDKLTTLLHFMKGGEPFSATLRYLTSGKNKWCPFTHADVGVNHDCYHANPSVQLLVTYIDKYAACCRYLDCDSYAVGRIESECRDLAIPERMSSIADFDQHLKTVKKMVAFIEPGITAKLSHFT